MSRAWVCALLVAAAGCGVEALPVPLRGYQAGVEPITVPFPPPPARADVIPGKPLDADDPVWVDGQWIWRGRQWFWQPGQWYERPPNQIWAAPAVVRLASGDLVWFEGRWRAADPLDPLPARREPTPP